MRRLASCLVLLSVLTLAVGMAFGQTTGQIKGEVLDEKKQPLPGVIVTLTGPSLQGERAVRTDAQGRYQFPVLPPGNYAVKFVLEGFQKVEFTGVNVGLGGTTPLHVDMKAGELVETMTVTAAAPLIDVKGTDGIVNLNRKILDTLPTANRTYIDVTKYAPSITGVDINFQDGTSTGGTPSIRGEGQYGDNYMIDGLSVRDPALKTAATPLPYQAIDEVQIITDGFAPEYGQALGGVINVITKAGSNDYDGEVAYIYTSDKLSNGYNKTFLANPTEWDTENPYVNFGGPIMKDKLWFYAAYNRTDGSSTYPATNVPGFGTLPVGDTSDEGNTYFGKVSWAITPDHSLQGNYTYRDRELTGGDSDKATTEARFDNDITDDRWRLNYQGVFTPKSVLEVRLGKVHRELNTVPVSPREPAQYEFNDFGVLTNNTWRLTEDERDRKDGAVVFTQYWNPGGWAGSHEFKGGYEYHEPESSTFDQFTGTGEDIFPDSFSGGSQYQFTTASDPVLSPFQSPSALNEYLTVPSITDKNEEHSLFVQDRWEFGNFNLLLGLRADKGTGFNNEDKEYFSYDFSDALAPRVSISWDATSDGKNVLKAGWGRFFDTSSTRFGEFANTAISFAFNTYLWNQPPTDTDNDQVFDQGCLDDFRNHIGDGSNCDIHNPANWDFDHQQSADATPSDYSGVEKPARQDRLLLEYDRAIGARHAFKARFVDGQARDLIDDVNDPYPVFTVTNTPFKTRDYQSFELEFNGNPTPYVSFNTSYVHSSAKGTSPGNFETGGFLSSSGSANEIGVFLDRPVSDPQQWCRLYGPTCIPPSWNAQNPRRDYNNDGSVNQFDRDMERQNVFGGLGAIDGNLEGWYGYLPYSIDDQIKLYGRFTIPQWKNVYVTAFMSWASGYHTQRKGYQSAYADYLTFSNVPVLTTSCVDNDADGTAGTFGNFSECTPLFRKTNVQDQSFFKESGQKRGDETNSSFWTLDMAIGKTWALPRNLALEIRGELFNLLNNQESLTINDQAVTTFGEALTRQTPRQARLFARFSF